MRDTRYETYTQTMTRTLQTMTCDNCGTTVDIEPLSRPEGWTSMQRVVDGAPKAWDFDTWDCVVGFVNAEGEEGPGSYLDDWKRSIDQLAEREADKILAGEDA